MAHSFSAAPTGPLADGKHVRRKVLVTGAAGNIGSYFAEKSHQKYRLRLMVRPDEDASDETNKLKKYGDVVTADVSSLDDMKRVCDGIDTVLHLAANPSPSATWGSILSANINGAYNTFVAAKACACR
ncbi:MAG: NAD-dependent epimerase/dehydratase family protein [Anaerolineae bacterium]|nr:NAD-dependent epimerase/dehydratase family protein [Phycisphaerae bacterium]